MLKVRRVFSPGLTFFCPNLPAYITNEKLLVYEKEIRGVGETLHKMCEDWKISLESRNNLIYKGIPHVPIFVEDIPMYLALEDHEENGIPKIQTMGELNLDSEFGGTILSLTPGNKSKFPISLKILRTKDKYVQEENGLYRALWDKHVYFKVYGYLVEEENKGTIEATHLIPINDVQGTWNVMRLLSIMARSEYRHYYRTKAQNKTLQFQWEKMKEEKKRLVKEKKPLI